MLLPHLLELNDLGPISSDQEFDFGVHRADSGKSSDEQVDTFTIDETADTDNGD